MVKLRILIIEDELKTASFLKKGLGENGFVVDIATDGEDGLHLAKNFEYDLIIQDIMLPKLDGWSVLSELRRSGKQTLTLILTARDSTSDKIRGLDLGADDYLIKPFSFSELMARIRSLIRRGPGRPTANIKIDDLDIDLMQRRVTRNHLKLDLTPKEFLLLTLLARRSGEVISRSVISEQVWDMNFDTGTNIVDVHIRRLRAKVDDPFEKKLIHTIRGMGYTLQA